MLKVGQQLWYVPSDIRFRKPEFVTVTKVGRKWASLNWRGYRISIDDLRVDGDAYSSPGQCYLSKEEYDQAMERQSAWKALYDLMRWQSVCPDGVDIADIRQARSLLFPNESDTETNP